MLRPVSSTVCLTSRGLVIYHPDPGTGDADKLAVLASAAATGTSRDSIAAIGRD